MELNFIKPSELSGNLKASIHKTGKLGFNRDAIKKLRLSDFKSAKIALDEKYRHEVLYMVLEREKSEYGFSLSKAGEYYYLNLKYLFDEIEVDYEYGEQYSYTIRKGDFDPNGWILEQKD